MVSTRRCRKLTQAGFLELFTELSEVLSAESAVVMTSRVSFLEDSPQVRRLMDGTSLMSEKLIQQLHVQGVDPLRVPRFSVLRLRDEESGGSLLGAQLASELKPAGEVASSSAGGAGNLGGSGPAGDLDDLLWRHIAQVVEPALVPRVVEFFGLAFLRGATMFTLVDLVNELGIEVFEGGRVGLGAPPWRSGMSLIRNCWPPSSSAPRRVVRLRSARPSVRG